jgi:hypothetical protein
MFEKKKNEKAGFVFSPASYADHVAEMMRDQTRTALEYKKIATELEPKVKELQKQVESLTKENADFKKQVATYKKELELMYLQAIGNANTANEVNVVVRRYKKQFPPTIVTRNADLPSTWLSVYLDSTEKNKSTVEKAATTKIKRLNRETVIKKCQQLNDENDAANYAMSMMALLDTVANIKVDGTKIIEAWKSGLSALSVFKSMLVEYKVSQDDVM